MTAFRWLTILALILVGCGSDSDDSPTSPPAPTRGFRMGFTPWPNAATVDDVQATWDRIHAHGDLVTIHLDGGIPWEEAFTGSAYHPNVEADLQGRVDSIDPAMAVVLAVSPLNTMRDDLAGTWGESTNLDRTGEWAARGLASPEVRVAYVEFMDDLIGRFDPDWVNYGIEITELLEHDPGQWDDVVAFCAAVHDSLERRHPGLPLLISATADHPDSPAAAVLSDRIDDLWPYIDVLGISTYPYIFFGLGAEGGNPALLPEAWLSQAATLAGDLPIAIAETGWIGEDLVIPFYSLDVAGTEQWQAEFVGRLLAEADALDLEFVTWFTVADFDTMWSTVLGESPLAAIWRDTGLYDGALRPRPALAVWDAWLGREFE